MIKRIFYAIGIESKDGKISQHNCDIESISIESFFSMEDIWDSDVPPKLKEPCSIWITHKDNITEHREINKMTTTTNNYASLTDDCPAKKLHNTLYIAFLNYPNYFNEILLGNHIN